MIKMTIGAKIQTLRKQRGLSQEQLAEALGVSRQAVSKWEAEQSVPDIDKIISICDYFGVTTDYILRNAELPQTEPQPEPMLQNAYNVSETEIIEENTEKQKKSALLLAVAIALYILSVVPPILIYDAAGPALMFVMIAVATGIIVYRSILNSKNKRVENEGKEPKAPENPTLKAVKSSVRALAIVLYFAISFLSGAWYITWLIFPITAAINNIIEACFDLKDGDNK